jgi:uncharacterized short protein YbdD (DUF466 family)
MSLLRRLWRYLRRLSGDDAYEQYLAHMRSAHPERTPLTRAAFFREREQGKWSGINRCC